MEEKKPLGEEALAPVSGGITAEEALREFDPKLKTADPGTYSIYWYVDGKEKDSLVIPGTEDPAAE